MSLLGAEYDSEDSPAPPAQERPGLLAIVDYDAEPDEAQGDGGAAQKLDEMGASLDRMDAESAPRRVGVGAASVQVTVVKKTPPPRDGAEPAAASNGAASASEGGGGGSGSGGDGASGSGGANTSGAGADAPAFVIPDSPPGEVPPKMMEKFLGFAKKTREARRRRRHRCRHHRRCQHTGATPSWEISERSPRAAPCNASRTQHARRPSPIGRARPSRRSSHRAASPPAPRGVAPSPAHTVVPHDPRLPRPSRRRRRRAQTGMSVNDYIRNAKRFRNPDLLEMLVGFLDVRHTPTAQIPRHTHPAHTTPPSHAGCATRHPPARTYYPITYAYRICHPCTHASLPMHACVPTGQRSGRRGRSDAPPISPHAPPVASMRPSSRSREHSPPPQLHGVLVSLLLSSLACAGARVWHQLSALGLRPQ